MYCLSWSFLQVPLIIQLRNSLNSSSSADASSISCVVIDPGVEVTATNRTNTSDTLCASVESAGSLLVVSVIANLQCSSLLVGILL